MLIAQLSDIHIKRPGEKAYGQVDTAAFLRRAVAHLNALRPRPEIVLVTGDLTDRGTLEQVEHACSHLAALEIPFLAIPGNHDDRATFARFCGSTAFGTGGEAISYVVDTAALRLIMLDSSVPGQPHGWLDDRSLDLLREALTSRPERPTIVALHHPPVEVGIAHMDRQNLRNADALAEIIAGAPQVLAIVCGHIHRTIHAGFAGTPVIIAPSAAHAVTLDLDPEGPPAFRMEPPAVLLHRWQPEPGPYGRLITHTSFIGDYGADHPFFDADGRLID